MTEFGNTMYAHQGTGGFYGPAHSLHGEQHYHYAAEPQPHHIEHGYDAAYAHPDETHLYESPMMEMLDSAGSNIVWAKHFLH